MVQWFIEPWNNSSTFLYVSANVSLALLFTRHMEQKKKKKKEKTLLLGHSEKQ